MSFSTITPPTILASGVGKRVRFHETVKQADGPSDAIEMLQRAVLFAVRLQKSGAIHSSSTANFFKAVVPDEITNRIWLEAGESNTAYTAAVVDRMKQVVKYLHCLHLRIRSLPTGDRRGVPLALSGGAASFRAGTVHSSAVLCAGQLTEAVLAHLHTKLCEFQAMEAPVTSWIVAGCGGVVSYTGASLICAASSAGRGNGRG